ncbi:ribosylnicotinamide kinase [Coemansia biformis]|uniref:Ribosylnicotinamide kinase n=1 Tax=Coemansia biformis TaxID=1286918 RepID=A0A9W7Y9B4_9FUNG|nr:ribosylnicotinamide kinase [Coemansia biformis]
MADVIVFGLSGPSCSGKTAISLLLAKLFPRSAVVHQDDFYSPDSQIPLHPTARVQDWDSPASFDMQALVRAIHTTRAMMARAAEVGQGDASAGGREDHSASQWANPPEDVDRLVAPAAIASIRSDMLRSLGVGATGDIPFSIVLVDGILLFHDSADTGASPGAMCDAGALVFAQRDTLRQRREARGAYATKEGFWVDPPGYFDAVVWPNFVQYHHSLIAAFPQMTGGPAAAADADPQPQHWAGNVAVCSSDSPAEDSLRACVDSIVGAWHACQKH